MGRHRVYLWFAMLSQCFSESLFSSWANWCELRSFPLFSRKKLFHQLVVSLLCIRVGVSRHPLQTPTERSGGIIYSIAIFFNFANIQLRDRFYRPISTVEASLGSFQLPCDKFVFLFPFLCSLLFSLRRAAASISEGALISHQTLVRFRPTDSRSLRTSR